MLVPVVHEVLPVWEPPAVAAEEVVAAEEAAVVGEEDKKRAMNEDTNMRSNTSRILVRHAFSSLLMAVLCTFLTVASQAQSQTKEKSTAPSASPAQKTFDTPQQAAEALIQAAEPFDETALLAIFGAEGKDFVTSADHVQDKNRAKDFAEWAHEKNTISIDPKNPARAILVVGKEDWPLPVPIVKKGGKWYFDSKAGREEILYRRIGTNELDAIQVCRGYVEAQYEYATERHDNSGVHQYAQKIISTPGKQDGLYWRNADGSSGGPIGEAVAKAIEEGYSSKSEPYHGYYFKILKGQGPAAPLGQLDYVIKGIMIGGFALVAVPAEYRVTGVKTFMVSNDGIVYQKDLGPDSLNIFKGMELYNPDKTWVRTDDQWPSDISSIKN